MTYDIRLLTEKDADVVDAFLTPRIDEAYYLYSNILKRGLVYHGAPFEAEYFGAFHGQDLVGILSYSWRNSIQLTTSNEGCLLDLAGAVRPHILARQKKLKANDICCVETFMGRRSDVDVVAKFFGVNEETARHWGDDILYKLDLEDLKIPALKDGGTVSVRLAREGEENFLTQWRLDFNAEALDSSVTEEAKKKAAEEIQRRIEEKELYILDVDGMPSALCGVGGNAPQGVMVGPVWTPPEFRGRNYAKKVTAEALLAAAKNRPLMTQAYLFAVRPDAKRAYEAIGFKHRCDWRLAFPKEDFRFG